MSLVGHISMWVFEMLGKSSECLGEPNDKTAMTNTESLLCTRHCSKDLLRIYLPNPHKDTEAIPLSSQFGNSLWDFDPGCLVPESLLLTRQWPHRPSEGPRIQAVI